MSRLPIRTAVLAVALSASMFAAASAPAPPAPVAEAPAAPMPPADAPTREHLAPAGWEDSYHDWHYTPVVVAGDMIIVSGIPASVGDTYEAKVRWMFEQLQAHLATAGATLADVVELTSFHAEPKTTEEFQAEFARLAPIHKEFFPDHYPAWSAVGTTALLAKGAPIELRAVAIRGSGARPRARIAPPPAKAALQEKRAPASTPAPDAKAAADPVGYCAAPGRWAPTMAYVHLKNAGLVTPEGIEHERTRVTLLASSPVGPDLYRQVLDVVFVRTSGEELEVITRSDASSEECSMGEVEVFVIDRRLGATAPPAPAS